MKLLYSLSYLLFLSLILSCSSADIMSDYDRSFNYNSIKSYSITTDQKEDLTLRNISNAVSNELNSIGLVRTSQNPDVLIEIKPKSNVFESQDASIGLGTGSYGRGISGSMHVGIPIKSKKIKKQYVLEINNAKNGELIYQSIYTNVQKLKKETTNAEQMQIAKELLEDFPVLKN